MAPTLTEIMVGIDERLATLSAHGLRHRPYKSSELPLPHAFPVVDQIGEYRAAMGRGLVELDVKVYLFVSTQIERAGQEHLHAFASWTGARSIPLAIEADRTLGGRVDDCVIDSFRTFGIEEVGILGYFGGEFLGRVLASGVDD